MAAQAYHGRTARSEWDALLPTLAPKHRGVMEFFRASLPESDLDSCLLELFLRFADHALRLSETAPWCPDPEDPVFCHYVAQPRVNDEDLSFHRDIFYYALWPRIAGLSSMEERILEVNRWCCEHASYQAQDERTASPLTVYRCGSGRCGEESAFLVSALRSVGIPARQVYAPRWSHCDDNHAWVEALCDGQWRYLGACEPEPVLDRGWFDSASSRAVLVHSRLFGREEALPSEEVLGQENGVTWLNQTARYAETVTYTFRALIGDQPAAGAKFYLQVLNEAFFHTIAVLTADKDGAAQAALGKGSIHVLAVLDGLAAEGECGEDGIVLHLTPPDAGDTLWMSFDFHAPAVSRSAPAPLSEAQEAKRVRDRQQGEQLRRKRLDRAFRSGREGCDDLLRAARGNCGEIRAFLAGPDGRFREKLVRTLRDKDLRDVTRELLEDHLTNLPPWQGGMPENIYWRWVACPWIALEKPTPWRGMLRAWLAGWSGPPAQLRLFLRELLEEPEENGYDRLYWTPEAAIEAGICDEKSRDVLLAAALRTLGIPARLRPLDGAPEYWKDGRFHPVTPEDTAVLCLTSLDGAPQLRRDWSLSRWTEDGWQLMNPEGEWHCGVLALTLPAGRYRLMTTVRLPGGDQLAARRELELKAGKKKTLLLRLRPCSAKDLLSRQTLPVVPAETPGGVKIPDLFRMGEGPVLALWLEEGGEPSEHVLNELLERRETLPVRLLFLVRSRDSLCQPTLVRALDRLNGAKALLGDWEGDLEAVARCLGRNSDAPPLMVLCDGTGEAVYSDSGYRVGAVELALRLAGGMDFGD